MTTGVCVIHTHNACSPARDLQRMKTFFLFLFFLTTGAVIKTFFGGRRRTAAATTTTITICYS